MDRKRALRRIKEQNMTTHDGYTFGAALAADPPNPIIVDGYAQLIHETDGRGAWDYHGRPAFVPEVPPGWDPYHECGPNLTGGEESCGICGRDVPAFALDIVIGAGGDFYVLDAFGEKVQLTTVTPINQPIFATSREIDAMEIAAEAFRARVYVMLDTLRELGGHINLHPKEGQGGGDETRRAVAIARTWAAERGIVGTYEQGKNHSWIRYSFPGAYGGIVIHDDEEG